MRASISTQEKANGVSVNFLAWTCGQIRGKFSMTKTSSALIHFRYAPFSSLIKTASFTLHPKRFHVVFHCPHKSSREHIHNLI